MRGSSVRFGDDKVTELPGEVIFLKTCEAVEPFDRFTGHGKANRRWMAGDFFRFGNRFESPAASPRVDRRSIFGVRGAGSQLHFLSRADAGICQSSFDE